MYPTSKSGRQNCLYANDIVFYYAAVIGYYRLLSVSCCYRNDGSCLSSLYFTLVLSRKLELEQMLRKACQFLIRDHSGFLRNARLKELSPIQFLGPLLVFYDKYTF